MAVALHAAADDAAIERVECGEQRRGAAPPVIVGHGATAALLHRQARLSAVEWLDLALLIDRQRRHAPEDRRRARRCRAAWWRIADHWTA